MGGRGDDPVQLPLTTSLRVKNHSALAWSSAIAPDPQVQFSSAEFNTIDPVPLPMFCWMMRR